MKLDITKLPILEGVILFLLIALAVAFTAAFITVADDDESSADDNGVASETPVDTGGGNGSTSDEVVVSMRDNLFDPDGITVAAGASVTFQLTNDGVAVHNMHITVDGEYGSGFCDGTGDPCSDPNVVPGGQEAVLRWTAPDSASEVPFRCDFHPIEMVGTITVQ